MNTATFQLMMKPVAEGLGHLKNTTVGQAGSHHFTGTNAFDNISVTTDNNYEVSERTVQRTLNGFWIDAGNSGGSAYRANFSMPGSALGYHMAVTLPHGQTLTEISIRINPQDVAALPTTMPGFSLLQINNETGGIVNVVDAQLDTSGDATAYSSVHDITATGLSHEIDNETCHYRIDLTASSGDATLNRIQIVSPPRAKVTATSLRDWT